MKVEKRAFEVFATYAKCQSGMSVVASLLPAMPFTVLTCI